MAELAPYAERLLAQSRCVRLSAPGICQWARRPHLVKCDALELLGQLDGQVDAWFSRWLRPAKTDMWTPELFTELARRPHARTTLGTFTAPAIAAG
jgi:tRNA 5-methylaminomethyl-2-thiouridine biosynthesis bifunctional protein